VTAVLEIDWVGAEARGDASKRAVNSAGRSDEFGRRGTSLQQSDALTFPRIPWWSRLTASSGAGHSERRLYDSTASLAGSVDGPVPLLLLGCLLVLLLLLLLIASDLAERADSLSDLAERADSLGEEGLT